ncbi:hypothetical protein [Actinomadura sp. SCN-SB]|uniref:hypothetical protein n=1 Tax=Actinomadura sp. SCN-SB TaxID=3373092 RepID=UPI003750A898
MIERYLRDMLSSYGAESSGRIEGNHNGYSLLLERILAELRPLPSLDLVVFAHARVDCDPRRSLSGTVSLECAGDPLCFAVSDQGETAAVTALDLVRRHLRHGWAENALVVLLDQTTHAGIDAAPGPAEDLAVGMVFRSADRGASHGWALRATRTGVSVPHDGPKGLVTALASLEGSLPPLRDRARIAVVGPADALQEEVLSRLPGTAYGAVGLWPVAGPAQPMRLWLTAVDVLTEGATDGCQRLYIARQENTGGSWDLCVFDAVPATKEAAA